MKHFFSLFTIFIFCQAGYSNNSALTEEELKKIQIFAKQIEASLENNNPIYFNSILNSEALLAKIITLPSNNYSTIQFNIGFMMGFKQNFDLGSLLVNEIENNGSYKYLRAYMSNNKPRILFRLFNQDGLNYHEYEITEVNGKYEITDIYVYLTGENISETLRRMYFYEVSQNSSNNDSDLQFDLPNQAWKYLQKAQSAFEKGRFEKAVKIWNKIEPEQKEIKHVLLEGIMYASYCNTSLHGQLVNKYLSIYPDDPGYLLQSITGFLTIGEYKKALAAIDKLDKYLYYDPMLNFIRGRICTEMGNFKTAITYFERILDQMSDFDMAYFALLDLLIKSDNFNEATQLLDRMTFKFNAYKTDFDNILQEYPTFINSSEYLTWISE